LPSCGERGGFGEYEVVGGIRVPTRAEVRWKLSDGPFVYWRGTIERARSGGAS
jgi:hypothetical protein